MKTIITYITFTLFGLLVMVNQQAMGQRRQYNGKDRQTTERKRPDFRYDRGYNTAQNDMNSKRNNEYKRNNGNNGNNGNNKYHNKHHQHHNKTSVTVHWRIPDTYHYRRTHWNNHAYHHAPWSHGHYPVVFNHKHGKVYYHQGRFYRLHNIYGYVIIEEPSQLIFTTIPADFHRVYVRGHLYFRFGDIWMIQTPVGYRIWRG